MPEGAGPWSLGSGPRGKRTSPPPSVAAHVAELLRSAIYNGELEPGRRLTEQELAKQFGVSHIPVREALARLAEEGLIEHLPRRGSRVNSFDLATLTEISVVRRLLEQHVVLLVQNNLTTESSLVLRRMIRDMEKSATQRDVELLFQLDCDFHAYLWRLSGNTVLYEVTSLLRSRINHFLLAANRALSPTSLKDHARAHKYLLDAIASGDIPRAQAAMCEHIDLAMERISKVWSPTEAAQPSNPVPANDPRGSTA